MNNMENNSCSGNKITLPVITSASSCGCSTLEEMPHSPPRLNQSFVVGSIKTPAGDVPQVSAQLHTEGSLGNDQSPLRYWPNGLYD